MDQIVLHRYFQGIASQREEEIVVEWVEASEENRKLFLKERMLYDMALFADDSRPESITENIKKKNVVMPVLLWGARIAAAVIVIWSLTLIFEDYKYGKMPKQQTVTVPQAQRAHIVLADGTKVWLNSKSTLTYAADFGRTNRNVELDGEAYFEVMKNSGMPFFVNTEQNKVKVVGTSFNVCAYKGSNEFETTLVEGAVEVYMAGNDKMITKLQKDEYLEIHNGQYRKTTLPSYDFLRWKEGLYCFDDQPFNDMLDKLEKYYGVKFMVENQKVLDYRCTGKFKEKDGVEHILRTIQKDHAFAYEVNEEKTIIRIR